MTAYSRKKLAEAVPKSAEMGKRNRFAWEAIISAVSTFMPPYGSC